MLQAWSAFRIFARRSSVLFAGAEHVWSTREAFVKQLETQISQCDALLALIGPHWLVATDEQGRRRLEGGGLCAHRDRFGTQAWHPCDTRAS